MKQHSYSIFFAMHFMLIPYPITVAMHQCLRTFPVLGKYIPSSLNFSNHHQVKKKFSPTNCNLQEYNTPHDIIQCLSGRQVFIIGNSVARHFAFHIAHVLDKIGVVTREEEKKKCPKEILGQIGGESCVFELENNIVIHNSWVLHFNGWPGPIQGNLEASKPGWEQDVCGASSTYVCLDRMGLFNASTSDILIFNMGIAFSLWDPVNVNGTEIRLWRQEQVRRFVQTIKSHFKGIVIYMDISPMRYDGRSHYDKLLYIRSEIANKDIGDLIRQETDWFAYDSWHINRPVMDEPGFYSDFIHYPGYLVQLGWNAILSGVCSPH